MNKKEIKQKFAEGMSIKDLVKKQKEQEQISQEEAMADVEKAIMEYLKN